MEVVYVPGVGVVDRDAGLVLAARWLSAKATESGRQPLVIVPVKDSVKNSPVLQALQQGGVEIQTHRTFSGSADGRPVLAVWPDVDTLHKVTNWGLPHSIGVVLWVHREDLMDWLRSQAATDLSGKGESFDAPSLADPVVAAALRSLTSLVNLGTGLSHPSDRASAIQMFRTLKRHGYAFDPAEVYQWAAGNGWSGKGADELRDIAEGVNANRRFRVERQMFRDDIIEIWRTEAAKS